MRYFEHSDARLGRLFAHPALDTDSMRLKKSLWVGIWTAILVVIGLTTITWFITPRQYTLFYYGCWLLGHFLIYLAILLFLSRNIALSALILNISTILITFYFILKLGGIIQSAGIIFNSLSIVTSSIGFRNARWTTGLFALFVATILVAVLLQPYLSTPPEMTPEINLMFFVINFLWLSVYITVFFIYQMYLQTEQEQLELKRQKALNEAKTKLYTSITHEFRTPLTIILGMAKQILEAPQVWLHQGLKMIIRNGRSLLTLVNQMLDLQKAETGLIVAHLVQNDIIPFIGYVVSSFESYANVKDLKLEFQRDANTIIMDFDPDKLMNILSNLISNAIKFTPKGGRVVVAVTTNPARNQLIMKVEDTGIGIPQEKLPFIYDCFFQVEDEATRKAGGTGIGLALTRELVRILNGRISVSSVVGQGTSFQVTLPITRHAPMENWEEEDFSEKISIIVPEDDHLTQTSGLNAERTDLPILLIVEDNADMVRYLVTCLENHFRIEMALDGKSGLQKALDIVPDIIISDIMMPEMNGLAFCTELKTDFRTSHIPLIFLSDKADNESKIEGFRCGADAYLTKPFFKKELLLRLHNLIEMRNKLRARYASQKTLPPSESSEIQWEDFFIQRVRELVETNLSDENFGVPKLCQELAMSRAQLYRKFEALTNTSIGKYIRTMRLHKAKTLLEKENFNVTEAAFETGFRNLSHFSTTFKEEFGISPSEITK